LHSGQKEKKEKESFTGGGDRDTTYQNKVDTALRGTVSKKKKSALERNPGQQEKKEYNKIEHRERREKEIIEEIMELTARLGKSWGSRLKKCLGEKEGGKKSVLSQKTKTTGNPTLRGKGKGKYPA